VKALLETGADPNAAGGVVHGGFFSVLTVAMNRPNKNRMELMDILIAAGAKVNPPRRFPESPLDVAVKEGDIEMLKSLLERGADVNWENEIGTTPLETAVSMGELDVEVIRLLLKAGADPNRPRLWEGDVSVSLLEALDGRRSRDKSREESRRFAQAVWRKKVSSEVKRRALQVAAEGVLATDSPVRGFFVTLSGRAAEALGRNDSYFRSEEAAMRRKNWRIVIVGLVLIVIALVFFFFMLSVASKSNDPVALMQTVGAVAGVVGGISLVMIIIGLIGKRV
jgi:hypothetical protein